jgi:hypothetical protein
VRQIQCIHVLTQNNDPEKLWAQGPIFESSDETRVGCVVVQFSPEHNNYEYFFSTVFGNTLSDSQSPIISSIEDHVRRTEQSHGALKKALGQHMFE